MSDSLNNDDSSGVPSESEVVQTAKKYLEHLANVPTGLSLAEWSAFVNSVLSLCDMHGQATTEIARLRLANQTLIGALQEIKRTTPQICMNGNARMGDPDHIKSGWNVHMMAREAIERAAPNP